MSILQLTPDQELLAENLRRLLAQANEFEARRRRLSAMLPDRLALWPSLAEMGIIGAAFPEARGGYAGDARTVAAVMTQLGSSLAVEPYLASAVVAGRILQGMAETELKASLIEAVIAGTRILVLAHDAGDDPFTMPLLRGEHSGETISVNGTVRCVRHADVADEFIVSVNVRGALELYRVSRDMTGLTVDTYRLIDSAGGGDLSFRNAQLPGSARLAIDGQHEVVLHDALEWGVLGLVAEAASIVSALNSATFAYLGSRKQFGVPLGSFQALQHRAADMYTAAEELTAILEVAVEAMTHGASPERSAILCAAKVLADRAGLRIGHEAVQMHGGMGVSDELIVSHHAKRLAAIRCELGTADVHRLRFTSGARSCQSTTSY